LLACGQMSSLSFVQMILDWSGRNGFGWGGRCRACKKAWKKDFKTNTGYFSSLDLVQIFEWIFYQFAHPATTFPSFLGCQSRVSKHKNRKKLTLLKKINFPLITCRSPESAARSPPPFPRHCKQANQSVNFFYRKPMSRNTTYSQFWNCMQRNSCRNVIQSNIVYLNPLGIIRGLIN